MPARRMLQETEQWVAWVRLGAFGFALFQVLVLSDAYPSRRYEVSAWVTTACLGVGALAIGRASCRERVYHPV